MSTTPPAPPWLDPTTFPFAGTFIDTDNARVHVIDEGTGPTLLMLHGNPTWSYEYREVIRALRKEFRCVAMDYPGFGLSRGEPGYGYLPQDHARTVARVIDELDLDGYTLVAHDWGGPIGLAAALQDPRRVAALAIGNSWAWPVNGDRHFEVFAAIMGGPVGRLGARWGNLVVNAMIPAGHRRRKLSRSEMRHYRSALDTPERRSATSLLPQQIVHARDFLADVEAGLATFADLPALLLWADGDIAFRRTELERWHSLLPNARTTELRGVGHFLPSDAPEEFAGAIRDWHLSQVRQ